MVFSTDTATVVAARAGDPEAVDRLVAVSLPLVYSIVGRALRGHADVDDVVQDTMLRVLRGLGDLREPASFRAWLAAITVRQVRERSRTRATAPQALPVDEVQDPAADFADVTVARLELTGQRREVAEATRWLDDETRELLSLWWLETSGHLTRDDLVRATGVSRAHTAVRVQRMKKRLDEARTVVRVLGASSSCGGLDDLTARWDGRPDALLRKRVVRHVRGCRDCGSAGSGLVPAERLLAGLALVPVPLALGDEILVDALGGTAPADGVSWASVLAGPDGATRTVGMQGLPGTGTAAGVSTTTKALVAAVTVAVVAGGGTAVAVQRAEPPAPMTTAAQDASTSPAPSLDATEAPAPTGVPKPAPTEAPETPEAPEVVPVPEAEQPPAPPVEAAPAPAPAPAASSAKKGVATWEWSGVTGALDDVGASWYYNWSPSDDTMPAPPGAEFVPMIWGRDAVTDETLAKAASEGEVLLGFNEPDLAEQSGMSVEEALAAWPRLEATGLRLGSPAMAWGADTPGGWLDRFMTGAQEQGMRVDFITLHWYGSDFSPAAVDQFLGYVDAVHARYGLPVWVTEYGLMGFGAERTYPTGPQLTTFIEGTTAGMEQRPFVERYAWFGLPAVDDSVPYGLYTDPTTPTEAGRAYRDAG
ncbi:sigma-70 family RNA polymerase sigma factor [Sanguibacter suaedae]|uniref:RNA polymerase sigma factor n=1 Tax=Sanguibacter suaedae TaxID=2795737 RepID=A0A934I930_9MICO|nr:sigma-70 family RNA polymerase sigma factor [Sanguibacter suaedae]MBI9113475.1 sigma-70 family RNA polymerase sigma factor [Sanguibacter suaedae]